MSRFSRGPPFVDVGCKVLTFTGEREYILLDFNCIFPSKHLDIALFDSFILFDYLNSKTAVRFLSGCVYISTETHRFCPALLSQIHEHVCRFFLFLAQWSYLVFKSIKQVSSRTCQYIFLFAEFRNRSNYHSICQRRMNKLRAASKCFE